ncbi:hypothetical protein CSUB01_05404 [Colletotrichum sublineola]|uniref:Uncharacterized protein n=1 Tax=Colletotrichum sublineola TaxID=1173701 RepID=A0A066X8Z8_COLSU|nr:hypothetical protein CSUB01_05404 [Colletotrichum sublineola]
MSTRNLNARDTINAVPYVIFEGRKIMASSSAIYYQAKKVEIYNEIHNAITKIHLSFNLWTSPNKYAIITVFCHFLDARAKQTQYLIALRHQPGSHKGVNIAQILLRVINK